MYSFRQLSLTSLIVSLVMLPTAAVASPHLTGSLTGPLTDPMAHLKKQDTSMTVTLTANSANDAAQEMEGLLAPLAANFDEKIDEMDAYLEAYAEIKQFSGTVLIAQGDRPPITRSYGLANQEHQVPNTPTTKFRIGSITKQFTAAAILQLQEEGLIDLQAPISKYLPTYPKGDQITVHHLLTHTAGIPEYLNPEIFPDLAEWMRQSSTLEQLVDRFKERPLEFEPGEKFSYSNSGYVLLTQIIETVAEQPYADYLQTHLFDPLGMKQTGYEIPQTVIPQLAQGYLRIGEDTYLKSTPFDMSIPQGAGGLYSTTADLLAWTQWLHSKEPESADDDSTVLSATAKKLLMQPVARMGPETEAETGSETRSETGPETRPETFYGYGLVVDTPFGQPRIHHSGGISGFATTLAHYPDASLSIAVLSNLETAIPARIAEDLAAIAFDQPYEFPKQQTAIELDPSLYEKYVGTYQLLPEMQITIRVADGELTAQATGQGSFVLYPTSETEFFAKVADITVKFSLAEDATTVEGLTVYQVGQELFAPKIND